MFEINDIYQDRYGNQYKIIGKTNVHILVKDIDTDKLLFLTEEEIENMKFSKVK